MSLCVITRRYAYCVVCRYVFMTHKVRITQLSLVITPCRKHTENITHEPLCVASQKPSRGTTGYDFTHYSEHKTRPLHVPQSSCWSQIITVQPFEGPTRVSVAGRLGVWREAFHKRADSLRTRKAASADQRPAVAAAAEDEGL